MLKVEINFKLRKLIIFNLEMLRLIGLLDETRLNWRETEIQKKYLKATNESLENENK